MRRACPLMMRIEEKERLVAGAGRLAAAGGVAGSSAVRAFARGQGAGQDEIVVADGTAAEMGFRQPPGAAAFAEEIRNQYRSESGQRQYQVHEKTGFEINGKHRV